MVRILKEMEVLLLTCLINVYELYSLYILKKCSDSSLEFVDYSCCIEVRYESPNIEAHLMAAIA
jgi:hypothetical protein